MSLVYSATTKTARMNAVVTAIGASGKLTGYAGGLDVKRWLLEHERATRVRVRSSVTSTPGRAAAPAA